MILRSLAALVLAVCPSAVFGETFVVQSGEHTDFSRLVVLTSDVPAWTFGRVAGGYELRTEDPGAEYDLARVFELIPRNRIKAVENRSGGRLFFQVDCDCHADAFEIRAGLVVDIKDGTNRRFARFEERLPPLPGRAETAKPDAMGIRPIPRPRAATAHEIGLADALTAPVLAPRTEHAWTADLAIEFIPAAEPATEPMPKETPQTDGSVRADRVAIMQEELIAQISKAASQGLITADLSDTEQRLRQLQPESHDESGADPTEDMSEAEAMPADVEAETGLNGPHIRIETAFDRGRSPEPVLPPMTEEGTECHSPEAFDVAAWGTEAQGSEPLHLTRATIFGEFDAASPEAVEALAKQYIYLTFGAEAKATLSAFDVAVTNQASLVAMADIMDFGTTQRPMLGTSQMSCDTNVAMWAVLSAAELTAGDKVSTEAVMLAFAGLPLHLRRHLGPYLADRFLGIGDLDTAASIRDAIARAPGAHGDGFEMIGAQIALEAGEEAAATEQLDALARADGPLAPEAVVMLINTNLQSGTTVPADLIENAVALAHETRGTEIGADLTGAFLRARAHAGDYLAVLSDVESLYAQHKLTEARAHDIRFETYDLAAGAPDTALFLQVALSGPTSLDQSTASRELRRIFAARLIEHGLPQAARVILAEVEGVPDLDDRRLYARSFLRDHRPDLAIGYLAGLTDVESAKLRAQSHLLAGEFDRAARVFIGVGDDAQASRAAWRAGALAAIAESGTEPEQAVARLALAADPGQDDRTGVLARNQQLLERSQNTRDRLAELLSAKAKP